MSIYIHGMEMPKTGYEDIRIFADGCVIATDHRPPYYRYDYRAIPVLDHGRLIDADALLSQYKGSIWTAKTDYAEGLRDVVADVKTAPTIIPADPADKEGDNGNA